jgi:transcriptional regulator with XRE-family HTH domain
MIRAQLLRIDRGLSVNQVANATGIANVTIARLEKSEKAGTYDVLVKLAEFFDVQPDELLTPVAPVERAA